MSSEAVTANSPAASAALALVRGLQQRFVAGLESLAREHGSEERFRAVNWLRDGGVHGGGERFETGEGALFWRGSVNVSQVHYDDLPDKKLGSANAISTIIHPRHPLAPSVHIHVSFTERKDGAGYWRVMADLNPSHPRAEDTAQFLAALERSAPSEFAHAKAQGERYFFIPVLERHRGVAHFYLEQYRTDDAQADAVLSRTVGEAAIDVYVDILRASLARAPSPSADQQAAQRAYHTLYLFQVLTLDRGTTSGLLVHDQNDVGIMGSLPPYVDVDLLRAWVPRMAAPQELLLGELIDALGGTGVCAVTEERKAALAAAVRRHYRAHPQALEMQAAGDVVPPTVANHA
ncbi:MAG: coproporphyrinogen III oxidase, partial [Pseudomonadota bacterium]